MLSAVSLQNLSVTRRAALQGVAAGVLAAMGGGAAHAAGKRPAWTDATLAYLETLARDDGGYAWQDQAQSHVTPTFGVVGCYQVFGRTPPHKAALAEFIRTHHPFRIKKLERDLWRFELEQVQSLLWLGENPGAIRESLRRWTGPLVYPAVYETHRFPVFQIELAAFRARELAGLARSEVRPEFYVYLDERRRANGSFNNTPAADGSDGHVVNTWWGLQVLRMLGRAEEKREETVAWVRACQLPGGGFTYQPKHAAAVNAAPVSGKEDRSGGGLARIADVAYTWAAVRILKELGSEPADRAAAVKYLHALHNADGGFGPRPGWLSNPMATYYAVDALSALGALDDIPATRAAPRWPPLSSRLKVFSIQIEAHGQGSPADAVGLAGALRIHLWGAKNAQPGWIERAQALADRQGVPVRFFVANEEYGTLVDVPGMGTYSHTSDIVAPAGVDFGPSLANTQVVSWEEFRRRRLAPLVKAGGRLIWQFGENEELARIYLDDSLQRGGYAAISTFHFGNPDFTNSEPFLHQYCGQIPYIGLQDAHGPEPWWWSHVTTGFRTLFLAEEATWDACLKALRNNWVVAVRHDAVSGEKTWTHSGRDDVLRFVLAHADQWRWWDNPQIARPSASLVALRPDDQFEAGRPERGVNVRLRCQWENGANGILKTLVVELISLTVDGRKVQPEVVARKDAKGALADQYHLYRIPDPTPGKHQASAVVREIATEKQWKHTVEFSL